MELGVGELSVIFTTYFDVLMTKYRSSSRSLHQVLSGKSAACCGSVREQSTQPCGQVPLTVIVLLHPSITQAEKQDFFILSCLSKLYRSSESSDASVFYFLLEQSAFTSVWIKMSTFSLSLFFFWQQSEQTWPNTARQVLNKMFPDEDDDYDQALAFCNVLKLRPKCC